MPCKTHPEPQTPSLPSTRLRFLKRLVRQGPAMGTRAVSTCSSIHNALRGRIKTGPRARNVTSSLPQLRASRGADLSQRLPGDSHRSKTRVLTAWLH